MSKVKELDFIHFGIVPNDERLLNRILGALADLYAFGNLKLRSAWLYYGGLSAAARAFDIPFAEFRARVEPNKYLPKSILTTIRDFPQINVPRFTIFRDCARHGITLLTEANFLLDRPNEWKEINAGADMLSEMSDTAREELFSKRSLPTIKKNFREQVRIWNENYNARPNAISVDLLESYLQSWDKRRTTTHFFDSVKHSLQKVEEEKVHIENLAAGSRVCSLALELLDEYELYLYDRTETQKFSKKQRIYGDSHHTRFFELVAARDGRQCKQCGSIDNLELDHIKAVAHGGLSVIENFQILCFPCNSKKGKYERALINGGITEDRVKATKKQ